MFLFLNQKYVDNPKEQKSVSNLYSWYHEILHTKIDVPLKQED